MKTEFTSDLFIEIFNKSTSRNEIRKLLGLPSNGTSQRYIDNMINELQLDVNVLRQNRRAKFFIKKICPVCGKEFEVRNCGKTAKQITCSYACSNTFYRTGENNGMYNKAQDYTIIAFRAHPHKCCICGEELIVAIHHYDENHENNNITNFVPLCPTHHQYYHSRFRSLVKDKIDKYHENFLQQNK